MINKYLSDYIIHITLKTPLHEQHLKTAGYYKTQIWCRFLGIFDRLQNQDILAWQKDPDFIKFERLSQTLLGTAGAQKISLLTENGVEYLTTAKGDVILFKDYAPPAGLTTYSQYLGTIGIYSPEGVLQKGSFIKTHLILDNQECPHSSDTINYNATPKHTIMELYTDVSTSVAKLFWLKIYIISVVLGLLGFFYIALFISSKKTEKIINKQHEEKLDLEREKLQAENQNQEKSMFLANVSHELRTPLNAIIGFSEIIKDEMMGPLGHPQYKEYIHDINTSGVHLLSLINDILDYSKAEARKLEVETVDVDVTKIAHSCMRLVEPRAKEAKVNLVENVPDHHVILNADPKRMKQIMLNLLSNAIKFTPETGQVTLSVREDLLEETVQFTVSDTGIGIAAKDISKAMSPFGQIDSSLSRRYEGTGLGLPLTKKLTDIMGGHFDIKSEVGVGTTITLTFPLKRQKTKVNSSGF